MATFMHDPNRPHVLGVCGSDIVHHDTANNRFWLDRSGIKNALFSLNNPIGDLQGKIDFIVCFVIDGSCSDFAHIDHTLSPRPLRGIIQLPYMLNSTDLNYWGNEISGGLGHEVGHYWLVPGAARINTAGGEVETPTANDIYAALGQGLPLPAYPIIAKQDAHWSPYINSDNSLMEGVNHSPYSKSLGIGYMGARGKYTQTKCMDTIGPEVNVPELGSVRTIGRFSLLERWIMGDYKCGMPPARSQRKNGAFSVLEPVWTFPLSLQAGIYAELSDGSRWYAGFTGGPHRLSAQKVGEEVKGKVIELQTEPFDPYNQIGLRLVQKDGKVSFQCRVWAPRLVSETGSSKFWRRRQTVTHRSVMTGLTTGSRPPGSDAFRGWVTLDTAEGCKVAKTGISLRNLRNPAFGLLSANLCQCINDKITPISIFDLREKIPKPGPRRLYTGKLMIPFVESGSAQAYLEDVSTNDAPKFTMNAPQKNFAFGGTFSLEACQIVHWAGRAAVNRTLIGNYRRVRFDQIVLPWSAADTAIRQGTPLNNAYKMLFCIVSHDDALVSADMFQGLERMRIAFEEYFSKVTNRCVDTAI